MATSFLGLLARPDSAMIMAAARAIKLARRRVCIIFMGYIIKRLTEINLFI